MQHQELVQHSISNNIPNERNESRLILQFNDPNWLHVYWEITKEKEESFVKYFDQNAVKDFSWALRIIPNKPRFGNNSDIILDNINDIFIIIGIEVQSKYIYIQHPRSKGNEIREFYGEYGLLSLDYVFFPLLRSNTVMVPTGSLATYNNLTKNNLSNNGLPSNSKMVFPVVNNYLNNISTSSEVYYDYTQTSLSS